MRFTYKITKLGDKKTVTRFSIFPIHVIGAEYSWLEFYTVDLEYKNFFGYGNYWHVIRRNFEKKR